MQYARAWHAACAVASQLHREPCNLRGLTWYNEISPGSVAVSPARACAKDPKVSRANCVHVPRSTAAVQLKIMSRSRLLKCVTELYQSNSHIFPQCRTGLHCRRRLYHAQAGAPLSIWTHRCDHGPPSHADTSWTPHRPSIRCCNIRTRKSAATFASAAVPHAEMEQSCWFCGDCTKTQHQFSCNNCGYLQPPDTKTDYFTLFGMKRTFDIEQKVLEKRFRDMQIFVHPDKHATKGDDVKGIAQEQSAHLNTGFSILRCPLARANYLLELEGKPIDGQARIDDPAFLMEVMDLREEVSAANGKEEIQQLLDDNLRRRTDYAERIRKAYNESDLDVMVELVQELTYFHRIEQSLREKL
eukprot:jgi/Ulvmu1/5297/UM022_0091.1